MVLFFYICFTEQLLYRNRHYETCPAALKRPCLASPVGCLPVVSKHCHFHENDEIPALFRYAKTHRNWLAGEHPLTPVFEIPQHKKNGKPKG